MKPLQTGSSPDKFDVAIIGSGIAGSTLAAVLARHGRAVLVLEGGSHPKFAIGESMILETSEMLRALAELYDVPELAYFSSENFLAYAGTSHGIKRHFSYLYHRRGELQQLTECLQAVIPKQPHGHELHLYRQDSDYYLTSVAIAYGATVLQNTRVAAVNVGEKGVEIETGSGGIYHADYVVDAAGFRSPLADQFDLRRADLRTHSRAIFTHMVDVPCFHDMMASAKAYGIPYRVSEGTLHHVFEGGWLWVIPFDNHPFSTNPLCSVGLMVDPRRYPMDEGVAPDREFWSIVGQYPDMARHLAGGRAVRDWTRTGRIQYGSHKVVGDRYCLLGHAAGFVDPLFSKGLYSTFMGVSVLAHLLLQANGPDDYRADRFCQLEEMTLGYVDANDRLIANAYKSFSDYRLWSVYAILWLLGAYTEYVMLMTARIQAKDRPSYYERIRPLRLAGGGFDEYFTVAAKVDCIMEAVDLDSDEQILRATDEIRRILDEVPWMPPAFRDMLHGKNHLPVHKLRPELLKADTGFLGSGSFRRHFFGDGTTLDLLRSFAVEKVRYSSTAVEIRRKWRWTWQRETH